MVLRRLSVSRRFLLVLAIGTATPAFIGIASLVSVRSALLDVRAADIRRLDEAAWSLAAYYHDRAAMGLMTEQAAKDAARTAILAMRYGSTNTFFIRDLSGNSVAQGGNFIAGPDAAEHPGVADMVPKLAGIARDHREGFGRDRMPQAGQTAPSDRIGTVKLFAPWGWTIGTVAEITDIDALFWSKARPAVAIMACLTALAAFLSFVLGRDLSRALRGLTKIVQALAGGDLTVTIPSADRSDEVGVMARAMMVLRQNATVAAGQAADLQLTTGRLEAALSSMVQGLCMHGPDGRLELFNRQFCAILGLGFDDIKPGLSIRDVIRLSYAAGNYPGQSFEDVVAQRRAFIEKGESGTIMIQLANNRLVSVLQCPMPNGGWVATYEDVTDRRAAEAKIAHMARHDSLTGLPNRIVLNERIEQQLIETGRNGQAAVLCLDLDGFKRVNDTLGHPVGDALLVAVAERLTACVREGDTVARLGGDEFAIVQAGIARPEDAKLLAERIIAAIGQPFLLDDHQVMAGVSIGLSLVPNDGQTPAALLKNADIALYRAKAEERGTFCFFEADMDARLQLRRQLELDLRAGLTNNEFELFYQPLVNITSNHVAGFEALLRWHHPKRGMVSPAEFIPIAEEIGVIVPLGAWVIEQACMQAACWPGDIKVAVNLSPCQFKSKNLVPTVANALRQSGLAASRLELEITETLLLQDNESTLATLHDLRALGTRISLDDFGTGYSSLSYLRSFPFDKIKIDQSFVRDLSHRTDSIHIVRAIKGLCAGLGMATTAEGVETEAQLEKICAEGCTEVQGYLFSAPRPAGEIPAILDRLRLRGDLLAGHAAKTLPLAPPVSRELQAAD